MAFFIYIYILLGFLVLLDFFITCPSLSFHLMLILIFLYKKCNIVLTILSKGFLFCAGFVELYPYASFRIILYVTLYILKCNDYILLDNILLSSGEGNPLPPLGGDNPLPYMGGNNPLPPVGGGGLEHIAPNPPLDTPNLDTIKAKVQWRWDNFYRSKCIFSDVPVLEGGFDSNITTPECTLLANIVQRLGLDQTRPFATLRWQDGDRRGLCRVVRLRDDQYYPDSNSSPVRPSVEFRKFLDTLNSD